MTLRPLSAWRTHPAKRDIACVLDTWLGDESTLQQAFDLIIRWPAAPRVLDFGAKSGHGSVALLRRLPLGGHLFVAEPAEVLDPICAKQLGKDSAVTFLKDPLLALPIPPASMDIIWCHNLMLGSSEGEGLIHEIMRLLAPGGKVYFRELEQLYFANLPPGHLLNFTNHAVHLSRTLAEADVGQVDLGSGSSMWARLVQMGLSPARLHPLSRIRRGPLSSETARILSQALPAFGLGDPTEPLIDPFNPDSPFYLLEDPDFLLIASDLLFEVSSPH